MGGRRVLILRSNVHEQIFSSRVLVLRPAKHFALLCQDREHVLRLLRSALQGLVRTTHTPASALSVPLPSQLRHLLLSCLSRRLRGYLPCVIAASAAKTPASALSVPPPSRVRHLPLLCVPAAFAGETLASALSSREDAMPCPPRSPRNMDCDPTFWP